MSTDRECLNYTNERAEKMPIKCETRVQSVLQDTEKDEEDDERKEGRRIQHSTKKKNK